MIFTTNIKTIYYKHQQNLFTESLESTEKTSRIRFENKRNLLKNIVEMIKKISKMHRHALEHLLWKKVLPQGGSNLQPLGYNSSLLPLSYAAYQKSMSFFKYKYTLLQIQFVFTTDFPSKFYKEFKLIAIYQIFQ